MPVSGAIINQNRTAARRRNHQYWLFCRRGFPANLTSHMNRRLFYSALLLCLVLPPAHGEETLPLARAGFRW